MRRGRRGGLWWTLPTLLLPLVVLGVACTLALAHGSGDTVAVALPGPSASPTGDAAGGR